MAREWNAREQPHGLADLMQELDTDLVFTLSLGSKELFHTNLLGWFAEHHREVADALLREWTGAPSAPVRSLREWQHLDLVLREVTADGTHGPSRVVVENKMFALPDREQLREYGAVVNRKLAGSPSLVLLSLADPGWPGGRWDDGNGNVWTHYPYTSLAALLNEVTLAPGADSYAAATLQRWTATIQRLGRLSELVGQPGADEPLLLPAATRELLGRLDAPVQKLRAHHLASRLREELGEPLPDGVSVAAGLTRGLGLVEAFVRVAEGVEAGWQLQGEQWRMAVRFNRGHALHGRGNGNHEKRAVIADRTGWMTFADESVATLTLRPASRDGAPRFGKYDPDFVYRYVSVPGMTLGTAVRMGVDVVRRALSEQEAPWWRAASEPDLPR